MGWFEAPADDIRPYADIDTPTFVGAWSDEPPSWFDAPTADDAGVERETLDLPEEMLGIYG
jgi:hypothetical protein